ncbi:hypothetical protein BH23GEM2_BH23GEM2_14120 [soil metagenome]
MSNRVSTIFAWWALAAGLSAPAQSQDNPSRDSGTQERAYQLGGVVTDAGREPLDDVEVTVVEPGTLRRSTKTDARGRFDLGEFPAGAVSFRVRHLGYEQRTVQVQMGTGELPTSVEIALIPIPEELEEVYVSTSPQGRLRGFYQRRQQRGTFGRFLEQEDIRRIGARHASELFRNVPGISIASIGTGNAIRIRSCQPMVWVDGQRVPGAELDEVVLASDIAAIEFYPSSAGVPAQYQDRGNRLCGLILVWTRTE